MLKTLETHPTLEKFLIASDDRRRYTEIKFIDTICNLIRSKTSNIREIFICSILNKSDIEIIEKVALEQSPQTGIIVTFNYPRNYNTLYFNQM
jgi:hypothetical protein